MQKTIKLTGFPPTDSVEEYVEKKIIALVERHTKRMDQDSILVAVEAAKDTQHHQKGPIWRAEVTVSLPGKSLRAEEWGEEIHEAIDLVENALKMELNKYKEKGDTKMKRGARAMKEQEADIFTEEI
jgi:ribosomal subunit interface protein